MKATFAERVRDALLLPGPADDDHVMDHLRLQLAKGTDAEKWRDLCDRSGFSSGLSVNSVMRSLLPASRPRATSVEDKLARLDQRLNDLEHWQKSVEDPGTPSEHG